MPVQISWPQPRSLNKSSGHASASATAGSASRAAGLHNHDLHRLAGMEQQEIRHVTANPAADRRAQQERLRSDRHDIGVEVG